MSAENEHDDFDQAAYEEHWDVPAGRHDWLLLRIYDDPDNVNATVS